MQYAFGNADSGILTAIYKNDFLKIRGFLKIIKC